MRVLGCSLDRGNDEPQAEGNEDGHPINNKIYKNKIWSDEPEVLRMTNADSNSFWVRAKTKQKHVLAPCCLNLASLTFLADS